MKRYYRYWVTGRGAFPDDMLRYDSAHRVGGAPIEELNFAFFRANGGWNDIHTVIIESSYPPTIERWNSFGWRVENVTDGLVQK